MRSNRQRHVARGVRLQAVGRAPLTWMGRQLRRAGLTIGRFGFRDRLVRRALASLAALASLTALGAGPMLAAASTGPEYLTANVLISDLGEFDDIEQSFRISFYVWYETDVDKPNHLEAMRVLGSKEILLQEDRSFPQANERIIHRRFIEARLSHVWEVQNYPYDQQTLNVNLDLKDTEYRSVRFIGSSVQKVIDPDIVIPGWDITGAAAYATRKIYPSSLGHPAGAEFNELEVPELELTITARRTSTSGFWKMMATALAAAGLACTAYFLPLNNGSALSPRFGLIAGSVFAVVLSMRQSTETFGELTTVTLTDKIHIAILFYISVATVESLFTHLHFQSYGNEKTIIKLDRGLAVLSSAILATVIWALMRGTA